ncbi:cupin domain-containing protein [Ruminococcus sp. FMBCY1]|nr:cupin domain-containing protein [Ruminococcus sp. FMBCY1]
MRTKQRNNLAETARHERVAQNTDVYAVKARNYKGLRRGSPVFCRNNWHIHNAENGGGQILVCVGGRGYYQEWGKEAVELNPGDVINIPTGIKHWHGAAPDSWFSHLAVEVPGTNTSNEWLEPVSDEDYSKLK